MLKFLALFGLVYLFLALEIEEGLTTIIEEIVNSELTTINNVESVDNEWVFQIPGSVEEAKRIIKLAGGKLHRKVNGFDDLYIVFGDFTDSQTNDNRAKRSIQNLEKKLRLQQVSSVHLQNQLEREKRDFKSFNDPLFNQQWQLHPEYKMEKNKLIRTDHQILDVWNMGFTGKNVVVTIIDDGIDYKHTDLINNYDSNASWDLNDNDFDPLPTMNEENSHGTKCAGLVAMTANNSKCGVGVAFDAKIGGKYCYTIKRLVRNTGS